MRSKRIQRSSVGQRKSAPWVNSASAPTLPHLYELQAIAARGNASVSRVEKVLYQLATAGESKEAIRSWAVRQAYWSLVYENSRGGMLGWHANNLLWNLASRVHLNEREVFGLWVQCAISQCGYGLTAASPKYFGKDLSELSERELARLVATVRSPTKYAPAASVERNARTRYWKRQGLLTRALNDW